MVFSYPLFLLIFYTSRILQSLSSTPSGVVDLFCGMLLVQWIGNVVVSHSGSVLYTYNFLPLNVAD